MGKQEKISDVSQKEILRKKYEAWKVLGVSGYVNFEEEELAKDLIEEIAKNYGFIPSYFATIILTEGLGIWYLDDPTAYSSSPPFHIRNDKIINGFMGAGTDDFGSEFIRYKKYLPTDYNEGYSDSDLRSGAEFRKKTEINEKGEKVVSAIFSNMESMIWACGATLAHRREIFFKAVKDFGYPKPSEDELAYWNYVYYQGEGKARRWLEEAGGLNIFYRNTLNSKGYKITKHKRDANDVALSNLASWRYLQTAKIFSK